MTGEGITLKLFELGSHSDFSNIYTTCMYNIGERSEPEKNYKNKINLWTPSPTHQISTQDPTSVTSTNLRGGGGGGGVRTPGPPPPPLWIRACRKSYIYNVNFAITYNIYVIILSRRSSAHFGRSVVKLVVGPARFISKISFMI